MSTLEELSKKIYEARDYSSNEKTKIEEQIKLVEESDKAVKREESILNYDFSRIILLLETYDLDVENFSQIINEMKNVLLVRRRLGYTSDDLPFEKNQLLTFVAFTEKLGILRKILNDKLEELSKSLESKRNVSNLEELMTVLDGTGKRKYYTEDMFRAFYDEFNILNRPLEEAQGLLEGFYQTKNLNSRQNIGKADFEDVLSLYKEFIPSTKFGKFEGLLNKHQDEIVSEIDLDNTREILQFFKDNGILDKFRLSSLLKISLYGKYEYISDVIYPKIMENDPDVIETFYEDSLSSVWIKEIGFSIHKMSPFRKRRVLGGTNDNETLYSSCHKINYDEFFENIEILKKNRDLFGDNFDIDEIGSNLNLKTQPTWQLKKNIKLCRLFGLGSIASVPTTCIDHGDIENKIHLAIELGLLNPPMTPIFNELDKSIVRNEEFQRNVSKKGIYNQSIRNYFQRYLSKVSTLSINDYAYLFYRLNSDGYLSFYNNFFSDAHAGKGNPENILGRQRITPEFIENNFMMDSYPDFIENYDEYDTVISEYNEEEKEIDYKDVDYIDSSIFDDPLIKELEDNNTVMNTVTLNNKKIERKNEFVYIFGNKIISRYKVLHNASILKNTYGSLTRDMLMTSIVRNSFLDKDSFQKIHTIVIERGNSLC